MNTRSEDYIDEVPIDRSVLAPTITKGFVPVFVDQFKNTSIVEERGVKSARAKKDKTKAGARKLEKPAA